MSPAHPTLPPQSTSAEVCSAPCAAGDAPRVCGCFSAETTSPGRNHVSRDSRSVSQVSQRCPPGAWGGPAWLAHGTGRSGGGARRRWKGRESAGRSGGRARLRNRRNGASYEARASWNVSGPRPGPGSRSRGDGRSREIFPPGLRAALRFLVSAGRLGSWNAGWRGSPAAGPAVRDRARARPVRLVRG